MSDYEWAEKQRLDTQAHEDFVREEGINNERYRIASELLLLNIPVEQIAKATKLTISDVESIVARN